MAVAHLSIFINGCLGDSSEWYPSVADAENAIVANDVYEHHRCASVAIRGGTCHKYKLIELGDDDTPGRLSAYMAEITDYPGLDFCECVGDRFELDNETGIFDPDESTRCMACESEEYDAAECEEWAREGRERDALGFCW